VATTLDSSKTWAKVEERLATETDPVLRRNLEVVLEHMKGEATLDYERIMATIAENPDWRNYFSGARSPVGWAEISAYYRDYVRSGIRFEMDLEQLVVDRDCIVTEGRLRVALPGRTLMQRGVEVDDPDAYYTNEMRICTLWRIDDRGKVLGEDTYKASEEFSDSTLRKMAGD
jgi:hypothetical protein